MSIQDFALIALGEILLAATFALGMLVGCSLRPRKESHGYRNAEKKNDTGWYQHRV